VLAGPPNAGKSTLFNRLLGRQRTLVSVEPGTTRDYVEAEWRVGPYGATLVDTAGLCEPGDDASSEDAIAALSREQVEGADVLIWMEGADTAPSTEELQSVGEDVMVLRVEAKRDLGTQRSSWLGVSATTGQGLDSLCARLREYFEGSAESPWIGLARHRDRAAEAAAAIEEATRELKRGAHELVAFELDVAEGRLGEICGRTRIGPVGEEVLDRIFSRFCIGK
jgi:tRNA modification GTPase